MRSLDVVLLLVILLFDGVKCGPEETKDLPCSDSADFVRCILTESSNKIRSINKNYGLYTDLKKPNSSSNYMSLRNLNRKWPKNERTGTYDVPYKFDVHYTPYEMTFFDRVFKNLQRGSNIRFVPYTNQASYLKITDAGSCFAFLGYMGEGTADGHVTVSIARPHATSTGCVTTHIITHELLHSLGFGHEHQRSDASKWVHIESDAPKDAQIHFDEHVQTSTPYDLASIMHYDSYLEPNDPKYYYILKSRLATLTSCDWAALNKAYPGRKKPPTCVPHEIPDVCEPTEYCPYLDFQCDQLCLYNCGNDYNHNQEALCRLKGGRQFPQDAMAPQDDNATKDKLDDKKKYPAAPPPPKKNAKYPAPPPPPFNA